MQIIILTSYQTLFPTADAMTVNTNQNITLAYCMFVCVCVWGVNWYSR